MFLVGIDCFWTRNEWTLVFQKKPSGEAFLKTPRIRRFCYYLESRPNHPKVFETAVVKVFSGASSYSGPRMSLIRCKTLCGVLNANYKKADPIST